MNEKIRSLIFDLDGVLWKDGSPLVNLQNVFNVIQDNNIRFAFVTNNSTKTAEDFQLQIQNLGIPTTPEQIFTSSTSLLKILQEKYPKGCPVYIIGENGLKSPLIKAGFTIDDNNALAVVGGMDRNVNYEKFKKAILLLQKGVDFFFTNSDTTFPTPLGIIPGAGSILRTLEAGSGKTAIVAGKPKTYMFERAMEYMSTSPQNSLVIGDRLDTDILGGLNANCLTAFVLSGISSRTDIKKFNIHPHLIHNNVEDLINYLEKHKWMI